MKTNLHSAFGTNKESETDGVWVSITDTVEFKIRRLGGHNAKLISKRHAELFQPYAKAKENNALSEDKEEQLNIKLFVDSVIVDWKGLTGEDGKELKYDPSIAADLLVEMPDLFQLLMEESQNKSLFKSREDLGNS